MIAGGGSSKRADLALDWPGILRLQAEVVAAWHARHDSETEAAA
jgi:hypothetical protein